MSDKSLMNIPYELNEKKDPPNCRFQSIWKVHANHAYQVNKPNGFQTPGLFVTFDGRGSFIRGKERHDLVAGTYYIVEEGTPCSYKCQDNDWKFYFIHCRDLAMASHLELPIGGVAATARIPEAIQQCEKLITDLIVQPSGYEYNAHIGLQELLLLFARDQETTRAARYPELDETLYHMHQNIGMPIRIDDLVRDTGLSRTAFFQRFRSMTGMSPSRYMLNLKLAYAKASLETSTLSVKEIASALQFYDEFHFSKAFKRRYGASPRVFRQGGNGFE